jgi:hypothetical protein
MPSARGATLGAFSGLFSGPFSRADFSAAQLRQQFRHWCVVRVNVYD